MPARSDSLDNVDGGPDREGYSPQGHRGQAEMPDSGGPKADKALTPTGVFNGLLTALRESAARRRRWNPALNFVTDRSVARNAAKAVLMAARQDLPFDRSPSKN